MFLPFRAKNPPESTPYVTYGLIAINTLVFACTSEYFWQIREEVIKDWAVSHNTLNPLRLFTAMFLHGDIFHLLGNMLFLWIFGTAAEGRLKAGRYLLVYLISGVVGSLLHDVIDGIIAPEQFGLGASGAIMGIAGAYLYMFPYAPICILWGWGLRFRVIEWHARWVILYYIGFDVFYGLLFMGSGAGGVAHFAHIGGFGAGFLMTMLLKARRDSEEAANAQAMRAEVGGDYNVLSLPDLEALVESQPENIAALMTFIRKARMNLMGNSQTLLFQKLQEKSRFLAEHGDPVLLAQTLIALPPEIGRMPTAFSLKMASGAESAGEFQIAMSLYRLIFSQEPKGPDAEMTLLRIARLTERTDPQKGHAAAVYTEMLRLFPNGSMAMQAKSALQRLGAPTILFSIPPLTSNLVTEEKTAPVPTAPTPPRNLESLASVGAFAGSPTTQTETAPALSAPLPAEDGLRPIGS